ncbi:hypothetical protein JD844_016749 [Phrynosoma platyrhinos]|uniref:Protein FAM217A n=1 Tax=Phrynosoma platyrhinos TaxID=52577 RepID=A0ABQ7SKV5_PHRPL|nr:hypothetical protein JD844_016749 [Phrynosoma platyrhinos]
MQWNSWQILACQIILKQPRDLNKSFTQMPSNSSHIPTNFVHTNPLVCSFMKRCSSVSSSGTQKTAPENSHRNGNGDIYKRCSETTESYPETDSSSDDMHLTFKRQMKRGNGNMEATLPIEEKDTPESDQRNKALLNFLKNITTNLKPDPIEHKEDISDASDNDMFSYPDFLPPPYNTLDLQKLSKLDDWRLGIAEPLDQPFDQLVSRLVRMERLQHLTILKEKAKETVSPAVAVNNHSSPSKVVYQLKQPRSSGLSCSQTSFDGDLHNFDGCVHEPDIPKCTSQRYHNKRTSGGLSPARSTTNHPRASCNASKWHKAPVTVDSTNAVTQRSLSCSGSASKIETGAKITYQKLLSSGTAVCSSFRDNESSKYKQARTKRKPCRTNGAAVMGKPSNSPSHTNQ